MVPLIPGEIARLPRYSRQIAAPPAPSGPVTVKPGRPDEAAGRGGGETAKPQERGAPSEGGVAAELSAAGAGQAQAGLRGGPGTPGAAPFGFQLVYPKGSALNLTKPSENSVEDLLKPDRYRSWQGVDFSRYAGAIGRSAAATGSPGGKSGLGGGPAGPPRGSRIVPNIVRYDFTPWANEVVNRIQMRWSLGQDAFVGYIGEVGVTVMMSKTGELLGAEIGASSKVDLLDQAALKAVRACAPFPPLPADFPNSSLEIYLVFQYGY